MVFLQSSHHMGSCLVGTVNIYRAPMLGLVVVTHSDVVALVFHDQRMIVQHVGQLRLNDGYSHLAVSGAVHGAIGYVIGISHALQRFLFLC